MRRKSNLIKLLKGECGEKMRSDNMRDLETERGQQRLLVPTVGVTAAYAEQAHKVTLNASSDIFARCSKLQTFGKSKFSALTISMLQLIRTSQLRWKTVSGFLPAPCCHCRAGPAWAAWRYDFLPAYVPNARKIPTLEPIILQS